MSNFQTILATIQVILFVAFVYFLVRVLLSLTTKTNKNESIN